MPWWAGAYVCVLTLSCLANHAVHLPACLRKAWIHIANWASTITLGLMVFAFYSNDIGNWLGKTAAGMMLFNLIWGVYGIALSRRALQEMRATSTPSKSDTGEPPQEPDHSAEWFSILLGSAMAAPAYLAGAVVAWKHWS